MKGFLIFKFFFRREWAFPPSTQAVWWTSKSFIFVCMRCWCPSPRFWLPHTDFLFKPATEASLVWLDIVHPNPSTITFTNSNLPLSLNKLFAENVPPISRAQREVCDVTSASDATASIFTFVKWHLIHISFSHNFFVECDKKEKRKKMWQWWLSMTCCHSNTFLLIWPTLNSFYIHFHSCFAPTSPPISLSLVTPSILALTCFPSVCRAPSWRLMPCGGYGNLHLGRSAHPTPLFQSVRLNPLLPASSINTFIQNLNPNPRRWFSKYFEVQLCNVIALLNVLVPKYRQTAG